MSKPITRITLFKIPNTEDQEKLVLLYNDLPSKALKDGKPYILSAKVGLPIPDQRSQGYTVAAISQFSSVEDMQFYDNECKGHADLRAFARTVSQGFLMLYFESP